MATMYFQRRSECCLATSTWCAPAVGVDESMVQRATGGDVAVSGQIAGIGTSSDAVIDVLVEPSADRLADAAIGESLPVWNVPAGAVAIKGSTYAVSLAPSSVPADYVSGEGLVTFVVRVTDQQAGTHGTTVATVRSVTHPETKAEAWLDPTSDPSGKQQGSASAIDTRTLAAPQSEDGEVVGAVSENFKLRRTPQKNTSTFADLPISVTSAAGGLTKIAESNRMATVATTYPIGGDWARFRFWGQTSTRTGVAFDGGGFWYAEGTKSTSTDFSHWWPKWTDGRSYQVQLKYGKFNYCSPKDHVCDTWWEPLRHTTGVGHNVVKRPIWWGCVKAGPGHWSMASSGGDAYRYGASVKFRNEIGIDLYGERAWLNHNSVVYDLPVRRRICGNRQDPGVSDKVMARYIP